VLYGLSADSVLGPGDTEEVSVRGDSRSTPDHAGVACSGRRISNAAPAACLYGYLYVLLQLEDYALLLGTAGLFVILASVMYLTRNLDWYAADLGTQPVPP